MKKGGFILPFFMIVRRQKRAYPETMNADEGETMAEAQTAQRFSWTGEVTDQMIASYQRDGFLMLEQFASPSECTKLMHQTQNLIEGFDAEADQVVFSASGQGHAASSYFMNSAANISFFLEAGAVDEAGRLIKPKQQAINKIGHALHDLDPVFQQFSHQDGLQALTKAVGFADPLLLQSMIICKQPFIGGEVNPHQDSTFLYTAPESCVGFWLAMEDATIENGCMWAAPGAHTGPLRNRFVRGADGMEMVCLDAREMESCDVPLEAPAGTLILLHGRLPHTSPENRSARSRYAYALHMIDGQAHYAEENWLQRPADMPLTGF